MKFRKSELVRVTVRYGLIAGAIILLLMVAFFFLGQHPLLVSPYLDFRIVLFGVFIFFSLKEYRDRYQNGILYFWQGMIGSYILIFISMLVASIGILIFAQVYPDFVTTFIHNRLAALKAMPQEEIDKVGKEMFDRIVAQTPGVDAMYLAQAYFGQGVVIGLFVSVIMSAILRKQPKTI